MFSSLLRLRPVVFLWLGCSLMALPRTLTAASGSHEASAPPFIERMESFAEEEAASGITGTWAILVHRARSEPFLPVASVIFLLAILHTFAAVRITRFAHRVQHDHEAKVRRERAARGETTHAGDLVGFQGTMLHFFGEVEAIFGIWVVVLLVAMCAFHGLGPMEGYLMDHVNFTEPLFVVIIMALASTRPILHFAEHFLSLFASLGRQTPAAWWLAIVVGGPLLGSLITEPGAMTISALLLARKFYVLKPSRAFAYGTLGLLFVNVSVGGVMTNFAAPPVLMVARAWDLTSPEMAAHFGAKAVAGIVISSLVYALVFRKELDAMMRRAGDHDGDGVGDVKSVERPVPLFVTVTHLGFMAWTVAFSHYPPLFVGAFLFFLAFSQATAHHQSETNLRGPILVGFFLASLVIHGGLQGWWLGPILASLTKWPLFIGSTVLTSFNDNAAITYLASQVEGLGAELKYAVLAGAVTGGGLTVIANAPNPAGQAILGKFFGEGIQPLFLALGAAVPTLLVAACFMLLPDHGLEEAFRPAAPAGPTPVPLTIQPH
jgi:hypothetical protein